MNDIRQDQSARKALLELASRVEQLTGPDRDIDAEIALACGVVSERDGNFFYGHRDYSVLVLERSYYDHGGNAPELLHYTASLDAAITLVPEGYVWSILSTGAARLDSIYTKGKSSKALGADSPASALTAAALRARAELLA